MIKLHQHTFGTGKPITLVHGWAMHSGIWRDFARQLARHYQVTCIDLPGHGRSDKLTPFALEQIVDVLANNVVDKRSCWLGWSLGATVVLELARRFPERVNGLILLAGNPHFTGTGQWPGTKPQLLDQFADNLAADCQATLGRFLALQVNSLPNGKTLLKTLKAAVAECAPPDTETLHGGLEILKNADLRPVLAAIKVPVLAVAGNRDTLVPSGVAQHLQQLSPHIQTHIIDKAGHLPFLSHPQELLAVITSFTDTHFMDKRTMPEKIRVKQSFSAAAHSYDNVARLQRDVGSQLLQITDSAGLAGTLLDLGCGTGFLTGELTRLSRSGQVIALDLAFAMLKTAQAKLPVDAPVHYVCADAECLPFADHSVDAVFSNLALQWCSQLDKVFADIKRVLKPGGQLVFSTFGTDTLQELKTAWASVDNYAHVNEFYAKTALQQHLQQAGFQHAQLDSSLYLSRYDSVLALMQELKQLGAHNVLSGRNQRLTTKTSMQRMIVAYQNLCGYDGISASFEVISGVAVA